MVAIMSNLITFNKVTENEYNELELKGIQLAGIAEDGIVLHAGLLNNELSDAIQYYYNLSYRNKYNKLNAQLEKITMSDSCDTQKWAELKNQCQKLKDIIDLLEECTTPAMSSYTFVNRLALAILNTKEYRISGEVALYNALKISGQGDKVELASFSDTRNEIIPILAEMLEIKDCPYLKPINVKLNLKEVSQLVAIANNTRTKWTNKGIKTKYSKTIETEVALQSILFVCRNAFKMVIPVNSVKDDRVII